MNSLKKISRFYPFLILVILVIYSQVILLGPIVGQGLTNEDYVGLFKIRIYQHQFFTNPLELWTHIGLHDIAHDFYIYVLNVLFGENYNLYLFTSIFLKIIATLLLYPVILLVTKNRLLAFLTTLLYGISYPATGALYLYVVGNEYLGVLFMNLFLIAYYFCIKTPKKLLLLVLSLCITCGYLASPIRIFPIFAIVILVELFILLKNRFKNYKQSLLRLVATFLPAIFITLFSLGNLGSGAYSLSGLPSFLKLITDGNWFFILNPIWGLGYLFLPVYRFTFLGPLNINNFSNFIFSLYHAEIIFIAVAIFLSYIISKKRLRFVSILLSINLFLDIIVFILTTHHLSLPADLQFTYSGPTFTGGFYSSIFVSYIISISITCGIEWYLTGRKNQLLFLTLISPFISLLFIGSQWIFTRQYYMYQEGIHRYFVIPAIGSSLFIASLMSLLYQAKRRFVNITYIQFMMIFLMIVFLFDISKKEISQLFNGKKGSGIELEVQQSLQNQALSYIPRDKITDDLLIFIKFASNQPGSANRWEDTFDWRNLTFWMHIKRSYLIKGPVDGCIALIWDESEIQKMARIQDGSEGFLYLNEGGKEMRCFNNGVAYSLAGSFLNKDNLYAFAVDESLKVINVTDEVKKKILFK